MSREKNSKTARFLGRCFAKMVPKRHPRRSLGCRRAPFWDQEWYPRPSQGPQQGTDAKTNLDLRRPKTPRDALRRSQTPRDARREAPRRNFEFIFKEFCVFLVVFKFLLV